MIKDNLNSEYIDMLSVITKNIPQYGYIVLGSMATLSYTSKIGYSRKMNDLDIIADESQVGQMRKKLVEQGFKQSTFINKRMPFYKKLLKHSQSIYFRFSRGEINIEILSTKFIKKDSDLKFDLYPNFWVQIPISSLVTTKLENAEFVTLDINLLWAIKYLLHNSLGKFMHYKGEQRAEDLSHLRKLVNLEKAKKLLSQCRFGYRSLSFHVPGFFLK
ncbi:MAG: hypothetical protein M1426_02170 [Patescibacteria group bacterium]|nr:hypothetical protein [Patescibacteria group bacterium]